MALLIGGAIPAPSIRARSELSQGAISGDLPVGNSLPLPPFFISVADKGLTLTVSSLESTDAGGCVSVDPKGVKRIHGPETLPASAGEEAPGREGRMDQPADQRLAEVLPTGRMA